MYQFSHLFSSEYRYDAKEVCLSSTEQILLCTRRIQSPFKIGKSVLGGFLKKKSMGISYA